MPQSTEPELPGYMRESMARAGLALELFEWCEPEALPEPGRSLLVHDKDMSSTLEEYYHEGLVLELLVSGESNGHYFREVILRGVRTGTPTEFGLIEIEIDEFPEEMRAAIQEAHTPLGSILTGRRFPFVSSPLGYFSVARADLPPKLSALGRSERFVGRLNQLSTEDGICLARIIEILPGTEKS